MFTLTFLAVSKSALIEHMVTVEPLHFIKPWGATGMSALVESLSLINIPER